MPQGGRSSHGIPTHTIPLASFGRDSSSATTERRIVVPATITAVYEMPIISSTAEAAPTGGTFVDAGAHAGFYCLALADRFERVLAFEPSLMQRELLIDNVEINGIANVLVRPEALGSTRSTAVLQVMGRSGGSNSLQEPTADSPAITSYPVDVVPLDEFGLNDLSFLKIDVEGWEVEVLTGARRTISRCRPVILMEVWEEAEARHRAASMLDAVGYRMDFPYAGFPEMALCRPSERD